MIPDSTRIARANGNLGRHISAAKPQAFVNEWRAAATDADCIECGETLYKAAFEIEPASAVSA